MADSLRDPLLNRSATGADEPAAAADAPTPPPAAAGATTSSGSASGPRARTASSGEQISDTVQMVKDYARQETLDPLKTAGRWIGLGLAGAVLIGVATFFLSLGLLRMVQTEWPGTFGGRWAKLAPYGFALLLCVAVAALAGLRINKKPLTKEKR